MKKRQRETAIAAKALLTEAQRAQYSRLICKKLAQLPQIQAAKIIFSYSAKAEEVQLSELHELLWRQGKMLCFPVSEKCGIMHSYRADSEVELKPGSFGIKAPDKSSAELISPEDIDAVIVPCVAFDENCRRLGYGGGYYDRFLPQCRKARFIAAAFEAQKFPEVFTDSLDVPMDMVITEERIYKKTD